MSSTRCATRTTILASSSAYPSSLAKSGCRCITDSKCRSTIIRKRRSEDEYHETGHALFLTKPLVKAWKPGPEWNTMDITLDGSRTIVTLNGVKVTDYKDGDPVPERKFDFEPQRGPRPNFGWFGLQNHSDNDIVFFKEVAIKPLKK